MKDSINQHKHLPPPVRIIDGYITQEWYESIQRLLNVVVETHKIQQFKPIQIKLPESARTP